jgi:alpha-beta hydrolase superfamily lysophospholipase
MTAPGARAGTPREGVLTSAGGRLRTLVWGVERPRGRVLVVHGLGDHAGRFGLLAEALSRRGYAVMGYDQRGHGKSEGKKGYLPRFDVLLEDLERVWAHAEATLAGEGPPFLYGHSMGGLVALRYLQTGPRGVPGAVLSAPWLATTARIPLWKELAASVLRRVGPTLLLPTSIADRDLTADEAQQRAYREDALVVRGISVAMYDAVRDAQSRALAEPASVPVPVLVLLPMADPVADLGRTLEWAARAGPGVEVERLPGLRHEPHNEREREAVFRRVADWLDARTRAACRG